MALEAVLSTDCKTLTITGDSSWNLADFELYFNNVDIAQEVIDDTGAPLIHLDSTASVVLTYENIPGVGTEELNGVIKIKATTVGADPETVELGVLGICNLNCCLAKKVKKLLECTCEKCQECISILDDTNKIYLLIQGMSINVAGCVQTTALYKTTIKEYDKAVEICGLTDCNCNC